MILNIRVLPPKTRKKSFKLHEFEQYVLSHKVYGLGDTVDISDFFNEFRKKYDDFEVFMDEFLSLWPYEYQVYIDEIFRKL